MRRDSSLVGKFTQLHWFLLLTICAIAAFGLAVLISAASSAHNLQTGKAEIHAEYAFNQGWRFTIMLGVALALAMVPLRLWAAISWPAYVAGVVLLLGVEVAGVVVNGAARWLQIGPLRLQPSELMKLAVPLALARYYHQMYEQGRDQIWVHIPALIIVAIPVAFVLRQPDLGTAIMIAGTGAAVIFFAGINLAVVIGGIVLLILAVPVVYLFGLHDYQRERIMTMFNPDADPLGAGYQLQQALIAIGSGGVGGKGFMEGTQKELEFIPEQHTDFIFTIIAEEFGFVGSVVLLAAWAICLLQGLGISSMAAKNHNTFGSLAAAGFVATLALYVFINIGMVIGLLPVVGIPLPLISYGGTVMLTVMSGFGLLLAVHLHRDRPLSLSGVI